MKVPQAIFTSAETGRMKGYQLVSRSAEIDSGLSQQLCRWSPTHASLVDETAESWSFQAFAIDPEWTVVARTFYGGPEYSSRGRLQIVTRLLVLSRAQMRGYRDNTLAFARTALALGRLSLPPDFPEQIPPAELPERPIVSADGEFSDRRDDEPAGELPETLRELPETLRELPETLREARQGLLAGRRVAVVGSRDAVGDLQRLIVTVPEEQRRQISFATGLRPSAARPFRLHFLPSVDPALQRSLSAQGIQCLQATSGAGATSVQA